MYTIILAIFFISFSLISCKQQKTQEVPEYAIQSDVPVKKLKTEKPITRLNAKSESLVKDWQEYQKYDELISQYQEISMSDALLNSMELLDLAKQLKDSIRVDKLNIPAVKIRLNVVLNESMRLADMSTIPTISPAEVLAENNNIINAFSALNLKINNMNSKERINSMINDFIEDYTKMNDSNSNQKNKPSEAIEDTN